MPRERGCRCPATRGSDRVGNEAGSQFQLDMFGRRSSCSPPRPATTAWAGKGGRRDRGRRRGARWREPDAGLWELENRWWTHSRLSVVCGLRRIADVSPGRDGRRYADLAGTILAETRRRCLHPDGFWRRAADDDGPEAALLLSLARGCPEGGDPATVRTRERVERHLAEDGYLYRFPTAGLRSARPKGLPAVQPPHGAGHARCGDRAGAFRWFERTRAACGPPGLFAEEYDVRQRQLRGNVPRPSSTPCCWSAPSA
ncbi:glycoside hydrolase family 15 protein [Streptomyces sp. C8S0]|uniref:glycoside hydrolase family 15 protein n=1 Tax=Streptomyces sp. C8S0 TaxID=2585716 RepID=UPI00125D1B18|nr:glycoside hydrolase family 15 protein [Streptomyces sp. C8S0]